MLSHLILYSSDERLVGPLQSEKHLTRSEVGRFLIARAAKFLPVKQFVAEKANAKNKYDLFTPLKQTDE